MIKRSECHLRSISQRDLNLVLTWRNSERVRSNVYTDHIITSREHKTWFEELQKSASDAFMIFEIRGCPVGVVQINRINRVHGRGTWGFYLGEREAPRGAGTTLGVLGVEYAFLNLGLRKLRGEAFAFNQSSIRFHSKLGFIEEGRFREHAKKNGIYQDVIVFGLLQKDWENNREKLEEMAFGVQGK